MRKILILLTAFICHSAGGQHWVDTTYQITTESEIPYTMTTGFAGAETTLYLDVSFPVDDLPPPCGRPLLVIVHGGAWFAGDKNEGYPKQLRQDFAKRGYVAASVDYRLGLFHTDQNIHCNVPDWDCFNMTDENEWYRANYRAIQDVHEAMRFLINSADSYQIDPDHVFIAGESAGGFVAMGVGFLDDTSEVLNNWTGPLDDAPMPNAIYESNCIQAFELAGSIDDMNLSRPDLGDYTGSANFPLLHPFQIKAVGNIFGGAFNNIFRRYADHSPALYLYHQPCDLIVPFDQAQLLAGYNSCLTGFPTFCQPIVNRPVVYGSRGIASLIDDMVQQNIPACEYYLDNSGNNYNCLQQAADPGLSCHAIDNYWLRTTNMAAYFASFIDSCMTNSSTDKPPGEINLLAVYPNPGHHILSVEFDRQIDLTEAECYNTIGIRQQLPVKTDGRILTADIHLLPPGLYYLFVVCNGTMSNVPFVKW